jgi:hypothetical protein
MWDDPYASAKIDWHLARSGKPKVLNERALKEAQRALRITFGNLVFMDTPLPADMPPLQLAMPDTGTPPDYFTMGGWEFCSRRFREALDQPEHVVQFAPVDLISGNARARAQDYRSLRVLAWQPAMDLQRSEYEPTDGCDPVTGQPRSEAVYVLRYALLKNLQPQTGIFRVDQTPGAVMVADAVAERMLRAGCTGVQFVDPTVRIFRGQRRICTATGVAEFQD